MNSTNATLSDQGTLTLNGALTIDAGTFQLADGGTFAGATSITNAGTIEFAESFTLANSITNTGTLQVDAGETLTLVGVTISGGTLSTASTGAIDVTGTSTLSGMTVNGGAIADSGTLNIAGLVTLEGGANITGGAMSIGSGATLDADTPSGSDTLIDVTVSIANTGTLKVDPATGAMLVLSGGTTVTGGTLWINIAGTVQVGAGGAALDDVAVTDDKTLSISASTTLSASSGTAITGGVISDLGTLEANGGLVTVSAGTSISGSGNVEVTNSGTADFLDAFNQAVTFSGAGMLELAQSTSFSAAVTGFNSGSNSGDVIDLQDVAYAVSDYTVWTQTSTSGNGSGTLQVYDGTTLERTLNLAGMYSSGNFALTADSGTGTEVIASPTTVTVSGLTSGNAEQGDLVMVSLGASLSNVTYTWLLDGQVVLGDSTDSYTPAYADQGKTLDVVVNFTDPTTGNTDEVTGVAGTVQANPNDLHWNNSAGGNWTTATDWTPNTVPNSTTQIAFIDASGTYTVNITSTVTVGGLTDASSTATLEINGGTLNADGAASITNLILTGTNNGSGGGAGTLQGSGTVDITNTLTSSGFAQMGGSGTTILDAGSTGSTLDFGLSRTLEIGGSATVLANNSVNVGGDGGVGMVEVLSGGTLTLQSGSGESDAALANSGSGNSVSNAGDLIESGSGLRRIDVALTNTGTVDAQSGTLDINGGGSSSGILQAEAGATLAFATGSFTLAANSQLNDAGNLTVTNNGTLTTDPTDQVSVSGALIVTSGGTLNLNSAVTPSSVTINGGTLNANATLTTATLTLTGTNNGSGGGAGTLGGSGTVHVTGTFSASSFAEMDGSGTLVLDASSTGSTLEGGVSRTVEVSGSANIAANTSIGLGSDGGPGTLEVLQGGTLTLQSTAGESDAAINGSGSGNTFSNAGTLIVSGGGQRNVGVALSNTGTVNIQSGTLLLNAGGSSSGTVQAESGATIQFGGGGGSGGTTFTLAANSQLDDAGNLSLIGSNTLTTDATDQMSVGQTLTVNGGTLNANASFTAADFTLTGTNNGSGGGAGLLSGSGTVDVSGTLTMSGFDGMEGSGTTILDAASTGSTLEGGLSRTLEIGGSASIQSNNAVTIGGEGAAGTLEILSGGTLTLLSGSGENSNAISNSGSGNSVSNTGTLIESGSGQRNIAVALSNSGTIEVQSGTLDVTAAVSGTGSVQISGGGVAEFGNTFNENVAFSGAGTLELAQSYSGTISSFDEAGTSDTLGLALSAARSGDAFTVTPNYNGTTTTLTVTDTTHTGSASVVLAGNYSSAALVAQNLLWSASSSATGVVTVTEAAPTADTWNDTTGNWATAADWSTGVLPSASQEAVLASGAAYTVTLTGTQSPFSVLLNDGNATLSDQGTLALTGSLTLAAGAFALTSSGTIIGGTITDAGSGMVFDGGTLQGPITYEGTMNLTPAGSSVIVIGSLTTSGGGTSYLTLTGVGGTGPGAINISSNSYLYLDDSQTINNATITLSGTNAYVEDNETSAGNSANGGAPEVLTFGSSLIIDQTGASGIIGTTYDDAAASNIVNDGTINAQAGTLYIASGGTHAFGFTNAGAITVSAGTLEIEPTTFTNAAGGSITADGGTTLYIGTSTATTWSNSGTVTIDSGAKLYMWGAFTTASLAGFTDNSTTTYLDGTLTNTGATLALGSGGTFAPLTLVSGTIIGGTITDAGSGMVFDGGTLQGPITYEGTMNLMPAGSSVIVIGSLTTSGGGTSYLTLTGVGGTGPGAINIGSNSYLYLDDSQTINNATITLSGTNAYVEDNETSAGNSANGGAPEVLTFGSSLIIDQTGASGIIGTTYDDAAASNIVNDGTINAQAGTLYIASGGTHAFGFTNAGAITVSAGTLEIEPTTFTNAAGGSITADGGTTLYIGTSTATTWSNSGTVTIDSGAKLYMWGAFTTASLAGFTDNSTTTYLDGTLTNTGATLALGSGGTFAPLTLVSGTIIGGTITDAGSGMVFDGGTLQGPITYEGTMNLMPANSSVIVTGSLTTSGGGTSYLTLTGVGGTGPGAINIGSNSYLYLDDSQTINNATITLSGTNAYVEDNETSAGNSANGGTPEVLTFGSSLIIDQTGASGIIGTTYDDAAASNIVNDGTINAQAGTLYIVSGGTHAFGFTNDGAIVISSGATAYIEPTTFNNGTGTVSFSGAGTLELGSTVTSFTETIGGFGAGAIIDLKNLSYSAADTTLWTQVTTGANAAGTLNISNGSGTVLETLNLAGTYSQTGFTLQGDSGGGTSGDVELLLNSAPTADNWTGAGGNSEWSNSANWSAGVPAANSEVSISSATVTFDPSGSPDRVYSLSASSGSTLAIVNGAVLTVSTNVGNSGTIYVDGPYGDSGGGSLTIDGTLTNSNFVQIGNGGGATGTITAAGLDNTGTIDIAGNGNTSPDLMNIAAVAPATWVGTLNISGDGELEFASGEIATIASGAQINLSGPQAWVADAGAVTGNTALAGLTSIAGQLQVANGALLTTDGALDNSGTIYVDGPYGDSGGGSLTIDGTLTNSNFVQIGNGGGAAGTITAAGLDNTGTIAIESGSTLSVSGSMTDEGMISGAGTLMLTGTYLKSVSDTTTISAAINNTGTVNVEAGTLELSGGLTNNGELEVSGGALDVTTAIGGIGTILFSSTGTFELANLSGFNDTFSGFGTTDTLDLGGFNSTAGNTFTTSTTYNGTDTTLTITDTTKGTSEFVTLVGNYTPPANVAWSATSDGSGGADVIEASPTADNWVGTGTTTWGSGTNWSSGSAPGATNEAEFTGTGSSAVTLSAATSQSPFSVWLDNSNITIDDLGTLNLSGALTLTAGTFTLGGSGTIAGGTIVDQGSGLTFSGGTLSGVTYDGTLNLSANSSSVYVATSLTATGANGTGAGTVNLTGTSDDIYFEGNQTFDNATINLGSATGYADYIDNDDTNNTGSVLTLGPNLIINDNSYAYEYIGSTGSNHTGDGIVNEGTINIEANDQSYYAYIDPYNFTNQGAINVANGDTLYIEPTYNLTNTATGEITVSGTGSKLYFSGGSGPISNAGAITVGAGATLYLGNSSSAVSNSGTITATDDTIYLYSYGSFSNTGTLSLTDSTIHLYGSYTTAQLAPLLNDGDTLVIDGTLTNTAAILNVGPGTSLPSVVLASDGTISGGTIVDQGSGLTFSGGTLSGVTYDGTLNLSANSSSVYVATSLTATGANGTGAGTVNLTGTSDDIYFEGNQTFDNATINLGSATGYADYIDNDDTNNTGSVLTLGPNLIINDNSYAYEYIGSTGSNHTGDGIVNEGTINIEANDQSYYAYIDPYNFTNQGAINVANGDTLYIEPTYNLTNTATGEITVSGTGSKLYFSGGSGPISNAGAITVGAGATLYLGNSSSAVSNSGTITATDDTIYLYSYGSFSNTGTLSLTDSTIHLYGSYTTAQLAPLLNDGDTLVIDGTLTNTAAILNVGPGTSLPSVVLASDGTISGGTIVDQGSGLTFSGGTLSGVTYDGTLNLSANSSSVYVATSLTATGANGTGAGTVNLTGTSDDIYFEGNQTFDNATINLGSATGYADYIDNDDTNNTGSVLTLGPNLIINDNSYAYEYIGSTGSNHTGDGIVNEGTINIEANDQSYYAYIDPYNFTNQGAINVANGDTLYIEPTYNLTNTATGEITVSGTGSKLYFSGGSGPISNAGAITVGAGATLYLGNSSSAVSNSGTITATDDTIYLYSYGSFSNTGTLSLTDSTIHLYGSYTTAQLAPLLNDGDTLVIDGTLTNTAAILNVGPGTSLPSVVLASDGTISGGTIVDQGSGLTFSGGTLSGVTYDGTLNLSANSSSVYVATSLTATGANGTGAGTVNLTGTSDDIYFEGNQTFDNATINLGSATGYADYIDNDDTNNTGSVLTLGPNLIINDNSYAYEYIGSTGSNHTGDGIVNEGTINIEANDQSYYAYIDPYNFTNQGAINVANGDTLYIEPTYNLTNTATGEITVSGTGSKLYFSGGSGPISNAGAITVGAGATLYLGNSSSAVSNSGTITATDDTIYLYSYGSFSNTGTLSLTDSTIHLYGSYTTAQLAPLLNDGDTLVIDGTLTNTAAILNVGPGTSLPSVVLASDGTISGGTIVDQGSGLTFSGGTLSGVTYDGTLNLSANSSSVYVATSLTATGANGTGAGTVNLTGTSDDIYFEGNQTFDNATINLGSATGYADYIDNDDTNNTGSVLTLGPNLIINDNSYAYEYIGSTGSNHTGDGIVNEGTINIEANDQSYYAYIDPYNFTNQGAINVANGDTLYIEPTYNLTNTATGEITVSGTGSKLYIEPTSFTNNGTITLSNGATLDITSPATGTGSYTIDASSTLEFNSTVASGATVYFGASIGTLMLEQPSSFNGAISASSGSLASGDVIYLKGFNATYTTATPTFNASSDTTSLLVTDPHDSLSVSLTLDGNYSADTFIASSASSGADIADPPPAPTIVNGGSLDISAPSDDTVTFTGATGSLVLNQPESFTGQIIGFTGTAPDAAHSDTIDLVGINYGSSQFAELYNSVTGLLTVTDGTNSASITFDDFNATLDFASDGNGGTLITDPPVNWFIWYYSECVARLRNEV